MNRRRAKILATLGPASRDPETLGALLDAGVNAVRLNFSHGSHEDHAETYKRVRQAAEERGIAGAILGDRQGPKIRFLILCQGAARANVANTAVVVPAGRHVLDIDYVLDPTGWCGTLLVLALLAGLVVVAATVVVVAAVVVVLSGDAVVVVVDSGGAVVAGAVVGAAVGGGWCLAQSPLTMSTMRS